MEGGNANLTNKKTGINKLFRQVTLAQTPSFRRSIWVMIPNTQQVYTVCLGASQKKMLSLLFLLPCSSNIYFHNCFGLMS